MTTMSSVFRIRGNPPLSRSLQASRFVKPTRSLDIYRSLHTMKPFQPTRSLQLTRSLTRPTKSTKSSIFISPSMAELNGRLAFLSQSLTGRLYASGAPRKLYNSREEAVAAYMAEAATNNKIIYVLIAVNVGVWGYFMYVKSQATQGYVKNLAKFVPNFTLNLHEFFGQHRYWQAITACFTHFDPMHLAFNMISFYSLGQVVAYVPGVSPGRFLALIIGAGLTGSAGYLAQKVATYEKGTVDRNRALGFSGCVSGTVTAAALIRPNAKMLIMGVVPAPLWALALGYMAYDGYYLSDSRSTTAHAGHLGGAAFGVAYYFLGLRSRIPKLLN